MASKYNPYNDYEKIVGYKANWHTAKNSGQDPTQYYQAAMPYYQSLINNGYSDLATELANSDHAQAGLLRDKYGLKADAQYNLDNDFAEMTGAAQAQAATPQSASDIVNAAHPNDTSINKLLDMASGATGTANDVFNTAQGIATGSTPIQPSAATQNLLDAYNNDYNRLNGQIQYDANGNVISGLNTEHYNIGRNQLDYYNNFDVTKQPYYQGIMDQYKLGGYNAAQGEYANGAANNGGNIDSYAAANANRQQLAFTTAGQQAALAAAQQNATNWNNLYAQMSSDLAHQGELSLSTLDIAKQMYQTDASERMNALDVEGSLASQQMESAIAGFQALVQERMNDKGITAEMAMQEKDIKAALEQLELQLASQERIQEGINALGYYQTDTSERMSQDSNATQRYGYDTQLAGVRDTNAANQNIAGINANASLGVAGINADASKYAAAQSAAASMYGADKNAEASMYNAGLSADVNRYLGELGYNQAMAGYQNALDQILTQGQVAANQSALDAQYQKEYLEYLAQNGYGLDSKGNAVPVSGTTAATSGLTYDQVMQLDVQKFVQDAWNDYKGSKNTFKTVEDIYKAVQQYDAAKYAGANTKVYIQVLDDLIKYAKANTGDTSYIQYLLGTQTE